MKILLVNPLWTKRIIPPLNLCELAGYIRENGYREIDLLDLNESFYNSFLDNVIEKSVDLIKNYKPDIIGLTCNTVHYPFCIELCKNLKINYKVPIVLGGVHTSIEPDDVLKSSNADFAIRGEGEVTFLELLRALDNNDDVSGIKGLSYLKNGTVIHNEERENIKDLTVLPFPAYDLLSSTIKPNNEIWISASRGCSFQCHFCSGNMMWKYQRRKSPDRIFEEINYFKDRFGTKFFNFSDDCLIVKNKSIYGFLEKIQSLQIKWSCLTRVDMLDSDLMDKMIESGCELVYHGIESGSRRVRDLLNKKLPSGFTNEYIIDIVNQELKRGIKVYCSFMTGLPFETKEELYETFELAGKLKEMGVMVQFWITTPYPGTELVKRYQDKIRYVNRWKLLKQSDIYGFDQFSLYRGFFDKYKKKNPDFYAFEPPYDFNEFINLFRKYRNNLLFENFYNEALSNYIEENENYFVLNFYSKFIKAKSKSVSDVSDSRKYNAVLIKPDKTNVLETHVQKQLQDRLNSVIIDNEILDENLMDTFIEDVIKTPNLKSLIFLKPFHVQFKPTNTNQLNIFQPRNCSECLKLFKINTDGKIELCTGTVLMNKEYIKNRTDVFRFFVMQGLKDKQHQHCSVYPSQYDFKKYMVAIHAEEFALMYFHKKEHLNCIRYLKRSNDLGLHSIDVFGLLGLCYFELKDFNQSMFFLEKAYTISTNKNTSIRFLVTTYFQLKQYQKAILLAKEFLEAGNIDNAVIYMLGMLYEKNKEYSKALPNLLKAVSVYPKQGVIHHLLGTVYYNLNNFEQAISYAEKAIQLNHPADNNQLIIAMSHHQMGNFETALNYYSQIEENKPADNGIKNLMSRCRESIRSKEVN